MDFLNRMNETLDYIESHLTEVLSYEEIAKISCCSMHQFGRVFSYIVGIPLSEYIRRRRLTLAAFDLQSSNEKIINIAFRYGYDSPNSFTRAFFEMHNMTPKEARSKGVILKSYSRLSFYISIKGDIEMNYRIEEKDKITAIGLLREIANNDDGAIWNEFFNNGSNVKLRDKLKLYRPPYWQMGVYMTKDDGKMVLFIGAESDGRKIDGLDTLVIPPRTWAVFTVNGSGSKAFGEVWARISSEWLPTSGYRHVNDYELEVFPMDKNADDPDYKSEIWIPVEHIDLRRKQ